MGVLCKYLFYNVFIAGPIAGCTPGNVPSLPAEQTLELFPFSLKAMSIFVLPLMGSGFHDGNILYPCSALCALVSGGFAVILPGCCLWSGSDTSCVLQAPPLLPEVCQTHLWCFVLITAGCPKFWVQTSQNENLSVF